MSIKYINFYNNLIKLTRNKILYVDFVNQDTFSDRLHIFLFHFAFFLNVFKSSIDKETLQKIFDYIFKELETSIREIGYGDASINKKMKSYINNFYSILKNIDSWDNLSSDDRIIIFNNYLNLKKDSLLFPKYFEKYRNYLKKTSFNSLLKGIIETNF